MNPRCREVNCQECLEFYNGDLSKIVFCTKWIQHGTLFQWIKLKTKDPIKES